MAGVTYRTETKSRHHALSEAQSYMQSRTNKSKNRKNRLIAFLTNTVRVYRLISSLKRTIRFGTDKLLLVFSFFFSPGIRLQHRSQLLFSVFRFIEKNFFSFDLIQVKISESICSLTERKNNDVFGNYFGIQKKIYVFYPLKNIVHPTVLMNV